MAEGSHPEFDSFVNTIAALRSPDGGCPWDRAQTHESLGNHLIEEAYEVLDAIQQGSADHLREELGDVLLQVVLHSQVATDEGEFTIDDVCATINEKMIRRHPHVFADVHVGNANEVVDLWEQVKIAEKAAKGESSEEADQADDAERVHLLDDVPKHFPALLQAEKISRKAVAAGFEWETVDDVWDKVDEERTELAEAYARAPKTADGRLLSERSEDDVLVTAAEMEFGDLLFALVNVGRKMGISAESALRASNEKFRGRFAEVEQAAWEQGRAVEDLSLDEMEAFWQQAKMHERAGANPANSSDGKDA